MRGEGLSTKVFPATSASGSIHRGTIIGKLNGQMPATTPTGNRTSSSSMPFAIWSSAVPRSSVGAPQARATTSIPRRTSPRASASVLPFSAVTSAASSSTWASRTAL